MTAHRKVGLRSDHFVMVAYPNGSKHCPVHTWMERPGPPKELAQDDVYLSKEKERAAYVQQIVGQLPEEERAALSAELDELARGLGRRLNQRSAWRGTATA